ncbi:MAG: hypothetical protein E3K37_18750 [Candidatus Kuenenia sp.]|nr:hypothetical protein [Candidatus Kuenenia hertensis]
MSGGICITERRIGGVFLSHGEFSIKNRDKESIHKKSEGRKYEYQENRTSALFFVKERLIALFTWTSLSEVLTNLKEKIIKKHFAYQARKALRKKGYAVQVAQILPQQEIACLIQ